MTYGQMVAGACAVLSGTISIPEGNAWGTLKTLFSVGDQASANFFAAFAESPIGEVAEAITGRVYTASLGKLQSAVTDRWRAFQEEQFAKHER